MRITGVAVGVRDFINHDGWRLSQVKMDTALSCDSGAGWRSVVWPVVITGTLAVGAAGSEGSWLGSIDGFLIGLVLACTVGPFFVVSDLTDKGALYSVGAVADVVGLLWMWNVVRGPVSNGEWIGCYSVLAAVLFAQWGWGRLLRRWVGSTFAAAIVVVVTWAWLSWPIWLSVHLSGQTPGLRWMVRLQPVLALNTLLRESYGVWTEQPFAYRFTNLNQDIAYALPSAWWCIGGFVLLGAVASVILMWGRGRMDHAPAG